MFCSFCGKEIRDGAIYCSQCGKNQATGAMKPGVRTATFSLSNSKKPIIVLASIILAVVLIVVCINAFGTKSIVGTWEDSEGHEVSFSSNGKFQQSSHYGTYTIYDDKKLSMVYQDFDYLGDSDSYEWGDEAMDDSDYSHWYISGKTLYWRGNEYTKK